ncbi:hypothetical protein LTR36_001902 [Oleoguttula mirabilis]|uniref:Uncharacterized protein n=1 Tax=Oleoguttula mirabilis TaxID=1507867 RepID=A0AAV9JNZ2_9PEZI|nr:hypothetical protein LTR36_001902 [Oleoguttula mirabilis]
MDASLRNTPGLTARIDKLRDDLIKHFNAVVGLAAAESTDRNATALTQYQMQVETAALVRIGLDTRDGRMITHRTQIRAAEDMQSLIRQLQEMWLFGQLNTVGDSKVKQQTDENAKVVAELLEQLAQTQQSAAINGTAGVSD